MENVLDLIKNVNVVEIEQQIEDRLKKLEERDTELFVLRRIEDAARAVQYGLTGKDPSSDTLWWAITPETDKKTNKKFDVQIDGNKVTYTTDLHHKMKSFLSACEDAGVTTVHIKIEVEPVAGDVSSDLYKTPSDTIVGSPVAAQERIHTIERAPGDTSEEDAAAEVEAVFAERASEEVKPVVEEVAVPPAEVVTPPTPTPEPPITKPRSLSPDARNQQLSICDRAKIYLEFAYNATAMAIGKGIDLPDPTCMVKHLQKDSRFVKDPRGFWKLAGT